MPKKQLEMIKMFFLPALSSNEIYTLTSFQPLSPHRRVVGAEGLEAPNKLYDPYLHSLTQLHQFSLGRVFDYNF